MFQVMMSCSKILPYDFDRGTPRQANRNVEDIVASVLHKCGTSICKWRSKARTLNSTPTCRWHQYFELKHLPIYPPFHWALRILTPVTHSKFHPASTTTAEMVEASLTQELHAT